MKFLTLLLKTLAQMWTALLWFTLPFSLPLVLLTVLLLDWLGLEVDDIHN